LHDLSFKNNKKNFYIFFMSYEFNNKFIKPMGIWSKFQKHQKPICLFLISRIMNLHVRRISNIYIYIWGFRMTKFDP
jgi:hypothetical protein